MAKRKSVSHAIKFDIAKEVFVCDQTFAALAADDKLISLRSDRQLAPDEKETRVLFADGLYSIKAHATEVFFGQDGIVLHAFPEACRPAGELHCATQQTVEVDAAPDDDVDDDDDNDDNDDDLYDDELIPLTPAYELAAPLHSGFGLFNLLLFDGKLPDDCMITLQRKSKKTRGYFSGDAFRKTDGNYTVDVIALNPICFLERNAAEVFSTLVHEMTHLWQKHFGTPSRNGYHNKEWAGKMESIGLMPSDTGAPDGKRTGQTMSHYIIPDGRFERIYNTNRIESGLNIPWGEIRIEKPKTTRSVYTCSACGLTVPGKRNIETIGCDCTGSWTRMSESVR